MVFRNESPPLPFLGEEGVAVSIPWFRHGIAVSIPWIPLSYRDGSLYCSLKGLYLPRLMADYDQTMGMCKINIRTYGRDVQ